MLETILEAIKIVPLILNIVGVGIIISLIFRRIIKSYDERLYFSDGSRAIGDGTRPIDIERQRGTDTTKPETIKDKKRAWYD